MDCSIASDINRENNQLKHELKRLGFEVPRTTWSFKQSAREPDAHQHGQMQHTEHGQESESLPHQESSSSSRKRTRPDYLPKVIESYPDEHFVPPQTMAPPPVPIHPRQSKPAVEVYSGGGWRHAHTSDEAVVARPGQSHDLYISDRAPPPRARHEYDEMLVKRTDGRASPTKDRAEAQPYSRTHLGTVMQDPHQEVMRNSRLPVHEAVFRRPDPVDEMTISPAIRQSFLPPSDSSQPRQRDSGYQSVTDNYNLGRRLPTRDSMRASAVQPVSQSMKKAMESPFFQLHSFHDRQVPTTPSRPNSFYAPQPERLVSGLGRMRMDIDETPPQSKSLNMLSFIQEPYSRSNKPVSLQSESQVNWPRPAASRQSQQFPMQAASHRPFIADPRLSSTRSSFVPPPSATVGRQVPSRSLAMPLQGFRGVKGSSSIAGPSYNAYQGGGVSNAPRFPYQQQRVLNTASGRRSVRR